MALGKFPDALGSETGTGLGFCHLLSVSNNVLRDTHFWMDQNGKLFSIANLKIATFARVEKDHSVL